jgi:hypothetical protein
MVDSVPDARLDAPAFHRNCMPIWAVIAPFLEGRSGHVLELGSGSGQHVIEFARRAPHIVWWPSERGEAELQSIAGWRANARLPNVQAPSCIDVAGSNWKEASDFPALLAIVCINVLHIAPWRVAKGLFAGAQRYLAKDARLFVYGPFMREGKHTAPSNAAFDRSLRGQDPEWGVRDTADVAVLAAARGLRLAEVAPMPANNFTLVFDRITALPSE